MTSNKTKCDRLLTIHRPAGLLSVIKHWNHGWHCCSSLMTPVFNFMLTKSLYLSLLINKENVKVKANLRLTSLIATALRCVVTWLFLLQEYKYVFFVFSHLRRRRTWRSTVARHTRGVRTQCVVMLWATPLKRAPSVGERCLIRTACKRQRKKLTRRGKTGSSVTARLTNYTTPQI